MNASTSHSRAYGSAASIAFCGLSVAFMTVSAWITVPFGPIPFTLQTLAVMFVLFALKPKEALTSIAVYLILGALGLPVFSSFKGGIAALVGPTGGFIVGFLIAGAVALAVGCLIKGKGIFSSDQSKSILGNSITVGTLALNLVMGVVFLLVLYAFGWAWLSYMGNLSAEAAFVMAVAPFVPIDAIKMFAAVLLAQTVSKVIK